MPRLQTRLIDSRSPEARAYREWYKTPAWRALRAEVLRREPRCRTCALAGNNTAATLADHVVPHRGDPHLFFNIDNLQPLCDVHHTDKQRIENGGRARTPIGIDGWPTR